MTAMLIEARTPTTQQPPTTAVEDLLAIVLDPALPPLATPTGPGIRAYTTNLYSGLDQPGAVRRILADRNEHWNLGLERRIGRRGASRLDDAKVCGSEIVTNALIHTDGPQRLLVAATETLMVVSVTDPQPIGETFLLWPKNPDAVFDADRRRMAEKDAGVGGWGIGLVKDLADEWGINPVNPDMPRTAGKHVWFAIARPAGA